ncbi:hypothetical protein HGO34_21090 [Agrobacterium vitis]|uniref:Uncharacterized protein n=1 Tax=Agrobacterium vitis TaxID=373 RepID=A0AAE4WGJ1_AGRVI|nr:hypothetical protein [Agrobacterium vitis]MCF1500088.1 hypothetical protein [Allorhizobium sp. Av2]MCM2442227.1 hypothetical protein [Agrobacterium vitis]MUZ58637.1 hypothetical protein [Agrobacterium vitis]MVA66272.1 hypothetical protein [Agrobacterium vitis]MVA88309.1 hypothetical protein [Agrobacterium vitis]
MSADEPALRQYIEATRAALARCPRFDIEFRGIVAAKTSILLCGYPQFDLQGLRRGLHKNLTELGFTSDSPEPDIADVRNTCHASLAVFGGLLSNPAGFADLIDRFQHLDFGTGPCGDTEIVSFARTGNNIAINRLCSA